MFSTCILMLTWAQRPSPRAEASLGILTKGDHYVDKQIGVHWSWGDFPSQICVTSKRIFSERSRTPICLTGYLSFRHPGVGHSHLQVIFSHPTSARGERTGTCLGGNGEGKVQVVEFRRDYEGKATRTCLWIQSGIWEERNLISGVLLSEWSRAFCV